MSLCFLVVSVLTLTYVCQSSCRVILIYAMLLRETYSLSQVRWILVVNFILGWILYISLLIMSLVINSSPNETLSTHSTSERERGREGEREGDSTFLLVSNALSFLFLFLWILMLHNFSKIITFLTYLFLVAD